MISHRNKKKFNIGCFYLCALVLFAFSQLSYASSFITNYTREDGLPQTSVTSIVQDDQGFMLFGTQDGLARFDGYQFTTFRHDKSNPQSLAGNRVKALAKAANGSIWIGSDGGLNHFDSEVGALVRIDAEFSLSITAVEIGKNGKAWIGTKNNGLYFTLAPYEKINAVKGLQIPRQISALAVETNGDLWIGSLNKGLAKLSADHRVLTKQWPIKSGEIASLFIDNQAQLWIGYFSGYGFDRINLDDDQLLKPMKHDLIEQLQGDRIQAFFQDNQHRMWIGSYSTNGVVRINSAQSVSQFRMFAKGHSLINDKVRSIYQDTSGAVWLGTMGGLSKLDIDKERFGHIAFGPDIGGLTERIVTAVFEDNQQRLWIGTFGGGLHQLDETTGMLKSFRANSSLATSLTDDFIIALSQGPQGKLWVGTTLGLDLFNPQTGRVEPYQQSDVFAGQYILDSRPDYRGRLWFKTPEQLHVYNPDIDRFCVLPSDFGKIAFLFPYQSSMWIITDDLTQGFYQVSFSNNQCQSLMIQRITIPGVGKFEPLLLDSNNHVWAGTPDGLIKISADLKTVKSYTQADGLPSTTIYGALEDNQGHIWFSSNGGLAKLDVTTDKFTVFDKRDGLQSDEFSGEASVKRANGQLVFAGVNGLNVFDPSSIKQNLILPKIYVTSATVFDKSETDVNVSGNGKRLHNGDHLALTTEHSGFEVEFTSVYFLDPLTDRFRYRLVGLDESWIEVGSKRRFVRYTNLYPGHYTLQITGANADGVWATQYAQVTVFVATPWWQTYWAYVGYFLVIVLLVYGFFRWRIASLKRENLALELVVNKRTLDIRAQKDVIEQQVDDLKALDKAKEHFFENISHEFRTPLSLVIGPLKRLSHKQSDQIKDKLATPIRQASRLLRLINQLLEISRLSSGVTQLCKRTYRPSEQIRQIALSFSDAISQKQLKLVLSLNDDLVLDYDASAMEKILVNLLSNAINYTPSGGEIQITACSPCAGTVQIRFNDNGVGIAVERQQDVFERFHQVRNQHEFQQGLGVGLALVKELVELHDGIISVQSTLGEGSCFTLEFVQQEQTSEPLELESLDELSPANIEQSMVKQHQSTPLVTIEAPSDSSMIKWTILVIDDEWDMRIYLSELLQDYHLLLAQDGKQGLDIAIDQVPDLIISDVMMPRMDGLALTKALREQTSTSHIPIILLTARGGRDSKLAGLREGVDDYIVKPFDEAELLLRVNNILVIRDELAKNFCDPETAINSRLPLPESEQRFITEFRTVLQQEYADSQFALVDMAKRMHLEKRQLQRKLKALLDTTPSEYLRSFRLHKAAQMLLNGKSVSQAMELSGFMTMSHFSRCFKARFGVAPSQYRRYIGESMSS